MDLNDCKTSITIDTSSEIMNNIEKLKAIQNNYGLQIHRVINDSRGKVVTVLDSQVRGSRIESLSCPVADTDSGL